MLKCGLHPCPSKCHQLSDHSKMPCEAIVRSKCLKNHDQRFKCYEGPLPACKKCDKEADEAKRKQQQALETQRKQEAERATYERELREINEKIQAEMEATRHADDARQRQEVLEQKRRDLIQITTRNMKAAHAQQHMSPTSLPAPSVVSASTASSHAPSDVPTSTTAAASPPTPSHAPTSTAVATSFLAPLHTPPSSIALPSPNPSASELEWKRQKDFEGASNDAIDALMNLTGLEDVKAQVLAIKAKIDLSKRQSTTISDERFNVCMLGNPGTGMIATYATVHV